MTLLEDLTQRLRAIAEREGNSPEAFLEALLDAYEESREEKDPIEDFIGAFDDDVTDLSTTVRQTLQRKFMDHDSPA
ncbi:MAG: hypothetical protein JXA10_07685 [Anaerolineae bacterium]|nr:hypothetical protein [Anaerolineae bacterium]